VTLGRTVLARLTSPFVTECLNSFQKAYTRTGMNMAQSIVLLIVAMGQLGWRTLSGRRTL
jgi:hypothetical protein